MPVVWLCFVLFCFLCILRFILRFHAILLLALLLIISGFAQHPRRSIQPPVA